MRCSFKIEKEVCRLRAFDEDVMKREGITDLSHYSVVPGANLYRDLFVD